MSPIAALLADRARAVMLFALSDGRALPACELALQAGVKAPTASSHLAKLVEGGLLAVEKHGRHRYYTLARPEVASLLEVLATVAAPAAARSFREGQQAKAVRFARSCYDHLAGKLGVEVTAALVERRQLKRLGNDYELTADGERVFERWGVDVSAARASRRVFARACLDWSERRHHLAGALGAALLQRWLELDWLERSPSSRALRLRERGRRGLAEQLGVAIEI